MSQVFHGLVIVRSASPGGVNGLPQIRRLGPVKSISARVNPVAPAEPGFLPEYNLRTMSL